MTTKGRQPPNYQVVPAMADEIEQELKRIGAWQEAPLPPEAYQFTRAFAADTMAFEQWLQFILLPRVRQIIQERGAFPSGSQVGAYAVREFDGRSDTDRLCALLSEFDQLFDAR